MEYVFDGEDHSGIGADSDKSRLFGSVQIRENPWQVYGSACGPVIVPVFKTGGRRVTPSPVGSTPTRFRHLFQGIRGRRDAICFFLD